MNVLISGGTGFVGRHLSQRLVNQGHHVFILTRQPRKHDNHSRMTHIDHNHPIDQLPHIHTIINLAGESIFGYWTDRKKERILMSRIHTTQVLLNMIKQMRQKPDVFINGSAIGYYGTSTAKIFTEKTVQAGDDFLANVVTTWEETTRQAETMNIRTVRTRFGVILGKDEGALPMMSLPVKLMAGGKIGSGEQWISWVHIEDVVRLIIHCMMNDQISGPINVTAPKPVRNKDFMKTLATVLKRPYWFPTPRFMMRIGLGEMSELITKGQYVLPEKAQTNHFYFSYPTLADALSAIYDK